MGFRRRKRLTDLPLPEALERSQQRSEHLPVPELLVWIEATALSVDRLISEYKNDPSVAKAFDAHHHALQLVGMTKVLYETLDRR